MLAAASKIAPAALAFAGLTLAAGCSVITDYNDFRAGEPVFTELASRDYTCPLGESPPCSTTEPDDPAGRTVVLSRDLDPPQDRDFVVSLVQVPAVSNGATAGFNIDGLDSGSGGDRAGPACDRVRPDHLSATDPAHVGVDNQLQALRSFFEMVLGNLDATLAREIAEGRLLIGVRVTGVDSLRHDDAVGVQLLLGASGQVPTLDRDGRVEADQTFEGVALGAPVTGDILDGRLAVTGVPRLDLLLDFGDTSADLELHDSQIRFNIHAGGLNNGAIGGTLFVEDIVELAERVMPGFGNMFRTILRDSYADLQPRSSAPAICDGVSAGLSFEAVPAIFLAP